MILGMLYGAACNLQHGMARAVDRPFDGQRISGVVRRPGRVLIGDVLRGELAIVGVETTGQGAARAEIMEIAALRVGPGLAPLEEFNVLVKPTGAVAPKVARKTGITQAQLDCQGIALHEAMRQLAQFVSGHPLFAHDAPVDRKLLGRAATQYGLPFDNPFYDSVMVAWSAWPGLPSYRLPLLADLLGLERQPVQRASATVQTTFALLRAASTSLGMGR